jgi:parvulin-like peptidyl-prolyl isomerase
MPIQLNFTPFNHGIEHLEIGEFRIMMTKMREMTVVGLWVLVIAFLAMMVLEWGADIGGGARRSNVVGKIEGVKISVENFETEVEAARDMEVSNTGNAPDFDRLKQIRDEVWDRTVQRILLANEFENYNIRITDREVALYILNSPLPFLQQNPAFQTDGKFDMRKYQEAVINPPNPEAWVPVENYVKENLPYQKLQDIVTSAATVTEQEIRYEFQRRSAEAQIEYIFIPAAAFTLDSVEVTEDDLKKYYQKNKDDFKVDEKRQLNYVLFSTDPTKQDSNRTYELANEVLQEAKGGKDFALLADQYSEDPTVQNNHGDLGYFERTAMVTEFSDAAFSTPIGELTGPVETRFGLHIIKVVDKKEEDGVEKVRASHVLIKFNPSAQTIEDASLSARNFYDSANEDGFQAIAEELGYEIEQTAQFTKRNYIPGFGEMQSAANWAFNNDVNDVSEIYRTPRGFVVFQISQIERAGHRPFEDVKNICRNKVETQRRMEKAKSHAESMQSLASSDLAFSEVAQRDTSSIATHDTTAKFKFDQSIPKIGRAPSIMATAFTLPPFTTSDLLESSRGYYYVRVLDKTEFNEENYLAQKKSIKQQLLNRKKQRIFTEWYENLKDRADIEDFRDQFYRG